MPTERTVAGLQMIIPGCEVRTLPKSPTPSDLCGQGLFHFYKPPSQTEKIAERANAPLRSRRGQRPLPSEGLFAHQ